MVSSSCWKYLSKCFLSCDCVEDLIPQWRLLDVPTSEDAQNEFVDNILRHPLCNDYPLSPFYVKHVLKTLLTDIDIFRGPICERLQQAYVDALDAAKLPNYTYCHYILNENLEYISIRRNDRKNAVGLRLWTAGLRLADVFYCLQTKPIPIKVLNDYASICNISTSSNDLPKFLPQLKGLNALELGAGVGCATVVAAKYCQLNWLYVTDYLPSILDNLRQTLIEINKIPAVFKRKPVEIESSKHLCAASTALSVEADMNKTPQETKDVEEEAESEELDDYDDCSASQFSTKTQTTENESNIITCTTTPKSKIISNTPLKNSIVIPSDIQTNPQVEISLLDWSECSSSVTSYFAFTPNGSPIDFLFASDVIYDETLTDALLKSMYCIMKTSQAAKNDKDKPFALLSVTKRSEKVFFYFIERAQSVGFRCIPIELEQIPNIFYRERLDTLDPIVFFWLDLQKF